LQSYILPQNWLQNIGMSLLFCWELLLGTFVGRISHGVQKTKNNEKKNGEYSRYAPKSHS
jgi:hypothetical protein